MQPAELTPAAGCNDAQIYGGASLLQELLTPRETCLALLSNLEELSKECF